MSLWIRLVYPMTPETKKAPEGASSVPLARGHECGNVLIARLDGKHPTTFFPCLPSRQKPTLEATGGHDLALPNSLNRRAATKANIREAITSDPEATSTPCLGMETCRMAQYLPGGLQV